MTSSASRQLGEEFCGFFQIGGIEALGEPAVDRGEEIAGLSAPALFAPQTGQARRRAQFQRFRLLGLRDADRLPKRGLALIELVFSDQHSPGNPVQFRIPDMLVPAPAIANPSRSAASAAARSPCRAKPSARNEKP